VGSDPADCWFVCLGLSSMGDDAGAGFIGKEGLQEVGDVGLTVTP